MADKVVSTAEKPALDPRAVSQLEEADWVRHAYRGDQPQLTLRAVVTGLALGFVLSFANVYIGHLRPMTECAYSVFREGCAVSLLG